MTMTARQGVRLDWRGDSVLADIRAAAREEIKAAQAYAVQMAKLFVPVDTGRLRDSIKAEKLVGNQYGTKGEISANTDYALYVEMGTYKMRSQPFLRPAADIAFRNFPKKLAARVNRIGGFP